MQACADELLTHWELDAAKHQAMTRPAYPDGWLPGGTIDFGDFGKLGAGANEVRLMVNPAGKVTDCDVHWPSLGDATNRKICNVLAKNAAFKPALDVQGNPMASYFTISPLFLMGPPPGGG